MKQKYLETFLLKITLDINMLYIEDNNNSIKIFLNEDLYNDIEICLNIIDKYNELNIIAKNYLNNEYFHKYKNCIKCFFEYFRKKILDKIFKANTYRENYYRCSKIILDNPDIEIGLKNNEIIIILIYLLRYDCKYGYDTNKIFQVMMNKDFNVIDYCCGEFGKF